MAGKHPVDMALAVKGLVRSVVAIHDPVAILVPTDTLSIFARKLVGLLTDRVARQLIFPSHTVPDPVTTMFDIHTGMVQTAVLLRPTTRERKTID